MFPYNYKKEIVKLIHLLTDEVEYYFTTHKKVVEFDKLVDKLISLLEEVKIGKNN